MKINKEYIIENAKFDSDVVGQPKGFFGRANDYISTADPRIEATHNYKIIKQKTEPLQKEAIILRNQIDSTLVGEQRNKLKYMLDNKLLEIERLNADKDYMRSTKSSSPSNRESYQRLVAKEEGLKTGSLFGGIAGLGVGGYVTNKFVE